MKLASTYKVLSLTLSHDLDIEDLQTLSVVPYMLEMCYLHPFDIVWNQKSKQNPRKVSQTPNGEPKQISIKINALNLSITLGNKMRLDSRNDPFSSFLFLIPNIILFKLINFFMYGVDPVFILQGLFLHVLEE